MVTLSFSSEIEKVLNYSFVDFELFSNQDYKKQVESSGLYNQS
jgi:hypothetical protein